MNKTKNITFALIFVILSISAYAVTISGGSSSYSFNVENCTAIPITDLNCTSANVRFQCDIGNPNFVDFVTFRIEGNDYLTTQNSTNPSQFYYNYNKPTDYISTNDPVTFDRQQITDVDANSVNAFEVVEINRSCTTCLATYSATSLDFCQLNNTQPYQFISSNETCSPSYNDSVTCNYCDANLIATTTQCDPNNNTQTTTYDDLNYLTCCQATGLNEDCPTLFYPYNTPVTQSCEPLNQDFNCNVDPTPVLNAKMNVVCQLPNDKIYSCLTNIYQEDYTTLLQTNPEFSSTTGSLIIPVKQETRNSFTTENRILNAYYTKKELRGDTNYTLEIVCNDDNATTLKSQYLIQPTYHTPDEAVNRGVALAKNPAFYIATAIFIIAVVLFTGYLWRKFKRGL